MRTNNLLTKILKELIAIPSYVNSDDPAQNENALVVYLERWISTNTDFVVERQSLPGERYNLIVKSGKPKTLFLAHTDTVPPAIDAPFDQLVPTVKGGELYGRGATDMKSGIASLLVMLLDPIAKNKNFWVVFYADEEYDFLGMREFIKAYPDLKPEVIVSADGSDLQLGFGCRGLVEITARIAGKTGHPGKGTKQSAVLGMVSCIYALERLVGKYTNPLLGNSILNVAYVLGGQVVTDSYVADSLIKVGKQANVVPDVCEAVIEIRSADAELTAELVINTLSIECKKLGLTLEKTEIRHDLGAMLCRPNELPFLKQLKQVGFTKKAKIESTGYLDMQMAWAQYGKPPAVMFGSGLGITAHTSEERILLKDLHRGQKFYTTVLKSVV